MGLLDGQLRGAAQQLIRLLGGTATLRIVTTTHTFTTDASSDTTVDTTIKISPPEPYSFGRIDGTLVRSGDARCLVAAKDLEAAGVTLPAGTLQNVYLIIGSVTWNVVSVSQLVSGDLAAAVEFQLRR